MLVRLACLCIPLFESLDEVGREAVVLAPVEGLYWDSRCQVTAVHISVWKYCLLQGTLFSLELYIRATKVCAQIQTCICI